MGRRYQAQQQRQMPRPRDARSEEYIRYGNIRCCHPTTKHHRSPKNTCLAAACCGMLQHASASFNPLVGVTFFSIRSQQTEGPLHVLSEAARQNTHTLRTKQENQQLSTPTKQLLQKVFVAVEM